MTTFFLPDLGEGIHEAQIVRLCVKQGDHVDVDQILLEVETDKAAVEIPSPHAGIISKLHVATSQTIKVGDPLIEYAAEEVIKAEKPIDIVPPLEKTISPVPERQTSTTAIAAPAVRKYARDKNIDLNQIAGSGPGGRIIIADIEKFLSSQTPIEIETTKISTSQDLDKWGAIKVAPITQIRKTIAAQMVKSTTTIPHVTHGDEADVTELDNIRQQLNAKTENKPKITVLAFVIKFLCLSLKKYPIFNASFDDQGGQIIYKDYINIGIAVDTERGLIVPVIRNVDKLSLKEIAEALVSISERARSNKFAIEELRGGTFTVTNVGALGGTFSTPIINHPEVAILALGKANMRLTKQGDNIENRLMMPMSLSLDHRIIDGADSARFCRDVIEQLQNPYLHLLT